MTKSSWVASKASLLECVSKCTNFSAAGVLIERTNGPDVIVGCTEEDVVNKTAVERVLREVKNVEFIVVVPNSSIIDRSAWDFCINNKIGIGKFKDLRDGLESHDRDESQGLPAKWFKTRSNQYIERRLHSTRLLSSITRVGDMEYVIACKRGKELLVSFVEVYEIGEEEVLTTIETFPDVSIIVVTNPYAKGLSPDADRVAKAAKVRLTIFNDFIDDIENLCSS